ncbi:MAG: VacJ family lipoprotein [Candidatus Electrothrix sp. AR4]|nr:VacJ family lipoprotein [Candidatus Electrothrix sp. AR4]
MKKRVRMLLISFVMVGCGLLAFFCNVLYAADGEIDFLDDAYYEASGEEDAVNDPFEGMNRAVFTFNDYAFMWILNPIATEYSRLVPSDIRGAVVNFFYNLQEPVRIVNTLLQRRFSDTGTLLTRFAVNSVGGVAGLGDPAALLGFQRVDARFGQTLDNWGVPDGIFLMVPVLGPTTLRDFSGRLVDACSVSYLFYWTAGQEDINSIFAGKYVNNLSLHLGKYEQMKEISFDPYAALRDGFYQHRKQR